MITLDRGFAGHRGHWFDPNIVHQQYPQVIRLVLHAKSAPGLNWAHFASMPCSTSRFDLRQVSLRQMSG